LISVSFVELRLCTLSVADQSRPGKNLRLAHALQPRRHDIARISNLRSDIVKRFEKLDPNGQDPLARLKPKPITRANLAPRRFASNDNASAMWHVKGLVNVHFES